MTFFTNDTCYNLALVTVLALIILYLIGKFFSEEEFTVYFQNTDPRDYITCLGKQGNIRGTNSKKNNFCVDSYHPMLYPVMKSYPYTYTNNQDPIGYNNCVHEGGKVQQNSSGINQCTVNIAGGSYNLN